MKRLMPVLLIAALAFAGYWAFSSGLLTGNADKAPTAPNLPGAPDADQVGDGVGDAARGAEEGAKTAADTIAGLDPAVWRILAILGVVGCIVWVIKNPKRLAIALGLAAVSLLVLLMSSK